MHTYTSAKTLVAPLNRKKHTQILAGICAFGLLFALPRLAADANNILVNGSGTATNPAGTVITSATFNGIQITDSGAGTSLAVNNGNINVTGSLVHGIDVSSVGGSISIINAGTITASGLNTSGIVANAGAGSASLTFGGRINSTGQGATAVSVAANIVSVNSNGIIYNTGTNSSGFVVTGNDVNIRLTAGSVMTSGVNSSAIAVTATNSSVISIDQGVTVTGGRGTGAGIKLNGSRVHTIQNAGSVLSFNDIAISATGAAALNINNDGTITGIITGGDGDVTVTNNGTWISRSYIATTATSRSMSTVAVSNFGAGNNIIVNNGIVSIAAAATSGSFNTTGQYLPFGDTSYTPKVNGSNQAQLLNVSTFHNAGSLDFANGKTNDVFIITAGTTPGVNGNGVYVSQGGRILVDVYLNTGVERRADLLVLDNVEVGAGGATLIDVKRMYASRGALTTGDGIPLIEVKGTCADDAFALEHPVAYGVYQYRLYKGSADPADTSAINNWYLRSNYHPSIGGHLVNWQEGATMFRTTEHDRRGSSLLDMGTDTATASSEGKDDGIWLRTSFRNSKTTISEFSQESSTDNFVVQAGADIINQYSFLCKGDIVRIGAFGSYGNSRTTTKSLAFDDRATASIHGYSGAIFATWIADPAGKRGPYIDFSASLYQFDNALEDNVTSRLKFTSRGWGASLETGWAYTIEKFKITLEPQVQVLLDEYSMASHEDAAGVLISKTGDQYLTTRVGLRTHSNVKSSLRLYAEINWWHNFDDIELSFDKTVVKHSNPSDLWQIKLGAQADLGKSWTLWGNVELQTGKNYSEVGGMLGLRLNW